jgi:hypothetical protein
MTHQPVECRGDCGAGQSQTTSCPAIQNFKTAGEMHAEARKNEIAGYGAASVIAGTGFALTMAGGLGYIFGDPAFHTSYMGLLAVSGLATIFANRAAQRLLKSLNDKVDSDEEIVLGLKIHAKRLQDKVADLRLDITHTQQENLHLHASLIDCAIELAAGASGEDDELFSPDNIIRFNGRLQ